MPRALALRLLSADDVGVLTCLCKEELLDVVYESIAVLAEGDGAECGWV